MKSSPKKIQFDFRHKNRAQAAVPDAATARNIRKGMVYL